MEKSKIQQLKPYLTVDQSFIVITASQYAIVNTKNSPIFFNDTLEETIQVSRGNRNNTKNQVDIIRIPYESIEHITLMKTEKETIDIMQSIVTPDELEIIKKAIIIDHGNASKNENVKGSKPR